MSSSDNSASNACSSKWPPKLNNDASYENWKRDIAIWCELTDFTAPKQALAIHLSLSGRARTASSEIKVDDLKKDTGVKTLIEKLDTLFLPEKGRRQFTAFHKLYNLRRKENVGIVEFVAEFEHVYFNFKTEEMTLPDPVMAFMLLASCKMSESDVQLVMSAVNDVKYDTMKATLIRIFGHSISNSGSSSVMPAIATSDIKVEPVFSVENQLDEQQHAFYAQGRNWRGRSSWRGPGRGASYGRNGNSTYMSPGRTNNQSTGRKLNPIGRDGQVSRCVICDSRFHWAKDCPDSYENSGAKGKDESGSVHLSLFMGLTDNSDNKKLNNLVDESRCGAVIDTGCSTTVCGKLWLNDYMQSLTEYERTQIKESASDSTFTFGDGVSVKSIKRLTLPCWIGNIEADITTDVVECNIPLLLSKKSMKKAKMILDFQKDTVRIGNQVIHLQCTNSGHYVLPLYL